jgi:hypothetical protein
MKSPPKQYTDEQARILTEEFIGKYGMKEKKTSAPRRKRLVKR